MIAAASPSGINPAGNLQSAIFCCVLAAFYTAPSRAAEDIVGQQLHAPRSPDSNQLFASGFDSILPLEISIGVDSACAVMSNSFVRCWGANSRGQLGNLGEGQGDVPHAVVALVGGAHVAMGNYHACAITTNGGVKCWGANNNGQLGLGSTDDLVHPATEVPNLLSGGETALELVTGVAHTCVLTSSMTVKCWGDNHVEQCGQLNPAAPSISIITTPSSVDLGGAVARHVVAGAYHACALTSQGPLCWGVNHAGELGRPIDPNALWGMPAPAVPELSDVQGLISGPIADHVCAVDSQGTHHCWGRAESGQLGDGTYYPSWFEGRPTASAILGDPGFRPLAAGALNGCGIYLGAVWCWGSNGYQQLTAGAPSLSAQPFLTSITSGATDVAIGGGVVCAIVDNVVECWGINDEGVLGRDLLCGDPDPNACTSPIPAPVHGLQ